MRHTPWEVKNRDKGNDSDLGVVVFTSLFPHPGQPNAGLFIRERMFRVGKHLPLVVIAPVPWFPLQGILRRWRPHFRPDAPYQEYQQDFEIYHPRFFSVPGFLKFLDGFFMALGSLLTLWQLKQRFDFQIIDAHFAYPDGYAASLLGKWFRVPVTITLRGTEARLSCRFLYRFLMRKAMIRAVKIFSVSDSLKRVAVTVGIQEGKILVVGNGVDLDKFCRVDRLEARRSLGIPEDIPILVSVGGLCERKGFHRVIECLPDLRKIYPDIRFLIAGGASAEGDWTGRLKQQVSESGLEEHVRFLGIVSPDRLKILLSAADLFVLATRNEGWANVFLEAMACGLPVVTTNVGGNAEVVCNTELGKLVPFNDQQALRSAIDNALKSNWNQQKIIDYAYKNSWDQRVAVLVEEFTKIAAQSEQAKRYGSLR
ncbi:MULTISPECIES: glycosyltransferase [Nitrosomonas]|uniref:Glycosyltransferase involved in cell wall biosynthesis n=3 Tax=Nitrosomonas eutropha TaxID=916 RepID=A0ABX5M5L7_9PROT|nr:MULTISPECIES: glycosyltransferase [Nitrosomonas]ABI59351.1 glycosyl transferase, group 1 [Nitrosomonas eutropha C91]MXS81342.1 glycosyltransferase family 4 protein [Nitrosomonas sp. GH22]PXV79759.1 glycosyltransferase involved in cell wall biosynthesis [Nitrosomonas eutropha]SDW87248.1 Glycosyltransferase involved in cell wall bisynthesis [Nitrosomonas eutropha]